MTIEIDRIDHFVLTVRSIDESVAFYQRVLGMAVETFAGGRIALRFGNQKINLHQVGEEIAPLASVPQRGSADFCLITRTGQLAIVEHLRRQGVAVEAGPILKTGAVGPITSVYFRDPDGNLVEVSRYAE